MDSEAVKKFRWFADHVPHFYFNESKQKWEGNDELLETFLNLLEDEHFLNELKTSLRHSRFQKHLDSCSEKVKLWPEWKRKILGGLCQRIENNGRN